MVQKIEKYKPTFHLNRNYKGYDIQKRAQERESTSSKTQIKVIGCFRKTLS
jgi:hypothetical protein